MRSPSRSASAAVLLLMLVGCGTHAPQLNEYGEPADIDDKLVTRIQASIYCEMRIAISELGKRPVFRRTSYVDSIPDNWGVQTTLQLQVDETGKFNPSGTGIPSTTLSIPFTAELSSQASRIDKYYSFYSVFGMKKPFIEGDDSCSSQGPNGRQDLDRHGSSFLLSGDLGIKSWMKGALDARDAFPSSTFPKSQTTKLDVISYDVKFIVITTGTVNPIVKLTRFTSGGGAPLLSANRTRTHDLLVTLGPIDLSRPSPRAAPVASPSAAATNVHVSGQIQQAFSSALQTLAPQR